MANMTFKAGLLPNTSNTYSLGSSSQRWKNIYGDFLFAENLQLTGELNVTGNSYLHNQTFIDNATFGNLIVSGAANFIQSPTAPTPADGDSSTKVATTAFIKWENVADKPSSFTPSSHSHGNITNTGELSTANRAVITDGNKTITISSVTSTELGYLNGVTSAIQTQLNAKAPLSSPALTGTPTAPTAAAGTNTTQIATTAFVANSIASLSTAMHFIGKATVAITDGSTTDPIISGYDFTENRKPGDVIIDTDNAYEYVWTYEGKWERLGPDGSYKIVQSAVSSPSASGNATAFIDTISQDANGVITITKKNLDTSGTWSGNAITATTASKLSNRQLWGQSFDGTANISGSISGAGNITPTTTITSNIGSASLRWNSGYFRYLYISNDENYTASTSAVNGITLSGDGGWIDLTSPDTSITPHIDFKLNKSALNYQVRLESDSPGRITIKRDTTNVTTDKKDPNKAVANVTYNNRSIDPVFQVTGGLSHFGGGINAATYLFNNSAAGGDGTGYYLAANNVTSGRLYIATRGLASVSDGADPPTYTDTPGRTVLQLGNAREGRPTIGVDDNATGWLRLYGESACFHDIRPSTAVRHQISYLPQYYTGTDSSTSTYYRGRLAAIYKGTTAGEDGFSDVGSISQPVYVTKEGIIKATDSFMRSYHVSAYYDATSRSWKKVATLSVDALPKLTGGTSAWIILQFFNGTTQDTIPMGTLRALVYRKDTVTSGVTTNTAITLKLDWIDCNLKGNFEDYKLVYTLTDNPTVGDSGNKDLTVDLWVKVNNSYAAIICKELAEGRWGANYPFGTFWTLSDSATATGTTVDKTAGFTTDPAPEGNNAVTSTYFISKGATGYLTYYSSDKTLAKTSFAHFNWKTGTTAEDGYEELVLGNSTSSGTDNNAFGRLTMYSSGTKGTYIVPANNTTAWYTATLQAKTGTIALTSDITAAFANNVTIGGTSTHTGAAAFNATGNSTHSKDTGAAVVVKGGVSVEKQISARTVRVDGTSTENSNTTPGGVSLQYDSTLQVLNFVFS